jgi:hypothetical protein
MRTRPLTSIVALVFIIVSPSTLAKHGAPPPIEPVIHQGVRYVVPNDKGLHAYVQAWDVQTGRKLWTKTVFRHRYVSIPFGRTECMSYEYVTSMVLQTNLLVLTSERGREYILDTRTRSIRQNKTKRPNDELQRKAALPRRSSLRDSDAVLSGLQSSASPPVRKDPTSLNLGR